MAGAYLTSVLLLGTHKGKTLEHADVAGDRAWLSWAAGNDSDRGTKRAVKCYLESAARGQIVASVLALPEAIAEYSSADQSLGAKVLFAVIYTAADRDPDGWCKLDNSALALRSGLSDKHVKRMPAELEAQGLIGGDVRRSRRQGLAVTRRPGDTPSTGTSCPNQPGTSCLPSAGIVPPLGGTRHYARRRGAPPHAAPLDAPVVPARS
jgi:hypothetical protein